jgi:hypothetical protein
MISTWLNQRIVFWMNWNFYSMQIARIQPSIQAAQAAVKKKKKKIKEFYFAFTFVSYKSLYILIVV